MLVENGFTIRARNFRYSRLGEIDIIASKEDLVVFMEVRARSSGDFGGAALSITSRKKRRIITTARFWVQQHYHELPRDMSMRFDVMAVSPEGSSWIQDAFWLE